MGVATVVLIVYTLMRTEELTKPFLVASARTVASAAMLNAPEYVVLPASQVPTVEAAGLVPSSR